MKRENLLDRGTRALIQLEHNPRLGLLLATLQLESELHKKQLFEDEANMSRGAGRQQVFDTFSGIGPVKNEYLSAMPPSP